MALVATERKILKVVAELNQATTHQICGQTGLSSGYVGYLCRYLVSEGYLKYLGKNLYCLAPEGKRILINLGYGLGLDKEVIKELASQVAKEVAKEIKIKDGVKVSPEEERKKVEIKTDYTLPVEDETIGLESNIERVGAKLEKEQGVLLDASVKLLKGLKKKEGKL